MPGRLRVGRAESLFAVRTAATMSNAARAPRTPRVNKDMVGVKLPPGAIAIVDSLVGTFLGATRSELLRFIVISWLADNMTEIAEIAPKDPHA